MVSVNLGSKIVMPPFFPVPLVYNTEPEMLQTVHSLDRRSLHSFFNPEIISNCGASLNGNCSSCILQKIILVRSNELITDIGST
jgi:hypothetical protein